MYWSVRCSLVAFLDLISLWTSAPGAMNQFTAISTSVTGQMINPVPSLTNLGHYFTCIFFLQQLYSNFSLDAGQLWPMYFLDVTSTASFFTRGRADRQDTAQTQWFLLELAYRSLHGHIKVKKATTNSEEPNLSCLNLMFPCELPFFGLTSELRVWYCCRTSVWISS